MDKNQVQNFYDLGLFLRERTQTDLKQLGFDILGFTVRLNRIPGSQLWELSVMMRSKQFITPENFREMDNKSSRDFSLCDYQITSETHADLIFIDQKTTEFIRSEKNDLAERWFTVMSNCQRFNQEDARSSISYSPMYHRKIMIDPENFPALWKQVVTEQATRRLSGAPPCLPHPPTNDDNNVEVYQWCQPELTMRDQLINDHIESFYKAKSELAIKFAQQTKTELNLCRKQLT